MFLSEKYKSDSFNQQYYKISRAPFVKMDIEPNSSLAEIVIAVAWGKNNSFEELDLLLIEHNSYSDEPFIDLKLSKDHPIYKEAEENLEELNTLQDEYERFLREIINSDLMLVHCVDHRFIPTDKLLGSGSNKPPVYLDPQHPMFSNELKIAIQAWTEVLECNPDRPKQGTRKKFIEDWLEKHYKTLTKSAKERITTLLNPDGNGGVSPTS